MSRTKRKGVWIRALKRGTYWMPGNPEFDKRHPNVSKKEFEENFHKYVGYKCDCSWCLQISKTKIIKKIVNQEIKEFKDGIE
jgi:hypothetical protein